MKAKSRKLFLLLLTFLMAISCIGIIAPAYASNQAVEPRFEMLGSSVRLEEPTGIKFAARIDEERYNEVISGSDTVFGAIIIPKDILGETEISASNNHVVALAGKSYLDSINNYSQGLVGREDKTATGYYTVSYSVSNVKYGNYNREFYGLVYIRSGAEGSYTYEYATVENSVNEKTIADVAKTYYAIAEDEDVAVLENFIYKAEFLANDTVSADYATSELSAQEYVTAQKAAIEEFDAIALETVANQISINASMEKYNALGAFAKSLVAESKAIVDEKQAIVCGELKNQISELVAKDSYVESDYHKIYGLKASYALIPAESKELVDNYDELLAVESEFLGDYEVEVVYGATESEEVGFSAQQSSAGIELSYQFDAVYGPVLKVLNGKGYDQRISTIIKENASNNYSGYKLYINAYTTNYSYFHYINSSIAWANTTDVVDKSWTQFAYDASTFGVYGGGRQIGFNLTKTTDVSESYYLISAVFAIKMTETGRLNATIAELNSKTTLEASDYQLIYGAKTNYETLTAEEQANVNYDTLLAIEAKFAENYDVKVVYLASETGASVSPSGNNSSAVTATYSTDAVYGPTLTITNNNSSNERVFGDMAFTRANYDGYNLYFNVKANREGEFFTLNSSAGYATLATLNADEWTTVSVNSAAVLASTLRMGLYSSAKLSVGATLTVSSVFAIKYTALGGVNAAIAELNSKTTLEASDYQLIYGAKTNYETLTAEEKAKVDYDTLLAIDAKFAENYDVKVVYLASETGASVSPSGNNSGAVTATYSTDAVYGPTLTITNGNANNTRAYGDTAFARSTYEGYTIYFNAKANIDCEFFTLNANGAYETLVTLKAHEWTTASMDSALAHVNTLRMGLYSSAKLYVGATLTVSSVFAIKAK